MYELLESKNIRLRKAKFSDYESMYYNVWSVEEVYKWMLFPKTESLDDALDRVKRSIEYQETNYAYFVCLKETDEAIGFCGIKKMDNNTYSESGICVGPNYQGKGYGKEILSLLLDLVFNKLNGEVFEYGAFKENIKSINLAKKMSFTFDHSTIILRSYDNLAVNVNYYHLTKKDYLEKVLNIEVDDKNKTLIKRIEIKGNNLYLGSE